MLFVWDRITIVKLYYENQMNAIPMFPLGGPVYDDGDAMTYVTRSTDLHNSGFLRSLYQIYAY